MRRPLILAILAGTFLATPALADVTVRYRAVLPAAAPAEVRADPPALVIAASDSGHSRLEVMAPGAAPGMPPIPPGGQKPSVAFITRDNVDYLALNGPGPGLQLVTRLDDALALLTQMAVPLLQGSAREGIQQVMQQRVEIHPVGPETVEGIQGNLYRLVLVNGEVRSPPLEMVVATDPRLAPAGRALVRTVDAMRGTVVAVTGGEPQVYAAIRAMFTLGAPLRIGQVMRVETVSMADVPDERFALPGNVLSREQLQQTVGMMMGMMRPGARPPGMPGAPSSPAPPPAPATPPADATNPH
ncbi:MAG TPA: hypothetical protein VMG08_15900 [Allosphingosinicella sp.]|nr:hypothetical protein [Allosphingosinicella sp.]